MRALDHQVVNARAFLHAVVMGCPDGFFLEVEGPLPIPIGPALAAYAIPQSGLFGSLKPERFAIRGDNRAEIAALVAAHADELRLHGLALRGADDSQIWFDAPHFGELNMPIFLHDAFPRDLAERLRADGIIQLDESELTPTDAARLTSR